MKRPAAARPAATGLPVALTAIALAAPWPRPLAAQGPRLVAPVYPGAVPAGEKGVWLTSDAPEDVRSFFEETLGPGKRSDGLTMLALGQNIRVEEGDLYWTVVTFDEARAITGEGLSENMETTAAGVVIEAPLPPVDRPPAGQLGSLRAVGTYFERLEHLTRVGSLEAADIEPVVRRYLPLASMRYRTVERADGTPAPLYEIQSVRCTEEALAGRILGDARGAGEEDLEAMTARLQALYAEGKIQEAMELQQKITEQAMGGMMEEVAAENEEEGLPTMSSGEMLEALEGCLAELAEEAYPTRFRISTHPSEWTVRR